MRRDRTCQYYPFLKYLLPAANGRRARRNAQRELDELKIAYADLLDEHVLMWSSFVMPRVPEYASAGDDGSAAERDEIAPLLEIAIQEILANCREALADLETASPNRVEGHKAIGKVLAYGGVTSILHRLQSRVAKVEQFNTRAEDREAAAAKKSFMN